MTKNEIIKIVIDGLMEQRKEMVNALTMVNHNEPNYLDNRTTFDIQINNIDMAIDRRMMEIEIMETKK